MAKKINVDKYTRKVKGKKVTVKSHKRKKRKLGKKIRYRPVGTFMVAHDELGNFRGSKIQVKKSKNLKKKPKTLRRRTIIYKDIGKLDSDLTQGKINLRTWEKARKKLMGLT